ncbi:unnamed protein product [Amoebophrya sp. A120]|nr:unnamed protein product [Amoebophrya sp. A120]|eukprot:GSA120T00023668001.1
MFPFNNQQQPGKGNSPNFPPPTMPMPPQPVILDPSRQPTQQELYGAWLQMQQQVNNTIAMTNQLHQQIGIQQHQQVNMNNPNTTAGAGGGYDHQILYSQRQLQQNYENNQRNNPNLTNIPTQRSTEQNLRMNMTQIQKNLGSQRNLPAGFPVPQTPVSGFVPTGAMQGQQGGEQQQAASSSSNLRNAFQANSQRNRGRGAAAGAAAAGTTAGSGGRDLNAQNGKSAKQAQSQNQKNKRPAGTAVGFADLQGLQEEYPPHGGGSAPPGATAASSSSFQPYDHQMNQAAKRRKQEQNKNKSSLVEDEFGMRIVRGDGHAELQQKAEEKTRKDEEQRRQLQAREKVVNGTIRNSQTLRAAAPELIDLKLQQPGLSNNERKKLKNAKLAAETVINRQKYLDQARSAAAASGLFSSSTSSSSAAKNAAAKNLNMMPPPPPIGGQGQPTKNTNQGKILAPPAPQPHRTLYNSVTTPDEQYIREFSGKTTAIKQTDRQTGKTKYVSRHGTFPGWETLGKPLAWDVLEQLPAPKGPRCDPKFGIWHEGAARVRAQVLEDLQEYKAKYPNELDYVGMGIGRTDDLDTMMIQCKQGISTMEEQTLLQLKRERRGKQEKSDWFREREQMKNELLEEERALGSSFKAGQGSLFEGDSIKKKSGRGAGSSAAFRKEGETLAAMGKSWTDAAAIRRAADGDGEQDGQDDDSNNSNSSEDEMDANLGKNQFELADQVALLGDEDDSDDDAVAHLARDGNKKRMNKRPGATSSTTARGGGQEQNKQQQQVQRPHGAGIYNAFGSGASSGEAAAQSTTNGGGTKQQQVDNLAEMNASQMKGKRLTKAQKRARRREMRAAAQEEHQGKNNSKDRGNPKNPNQVPTGTVSHQNQQQARNPKNSTGASSSPEQPNQDTFSEIVRKQHEKKEQSAIASREVKAQALPHPHTAHLHAIKPLKPDGEFMKWVDCRQDLIPDDEILEILKNYYKQCVTRDNLKEEFAKPVEKFPHGVRGAKCHELLRTHPTLQWFFDRAYELFEQEAIFGETSTGETQALISSYRSEEFKTKHQKRREQETGLVLVNPLWEALQLTKPAEEEKYIAFLKEKNMHRKQDPKGTDQSKLQDKINQRRHEEKDREQITQKGKGRGGKRSGASSAAFAKKKDDEYDSDESEMSRLLKPVGLRILEYMGRKNIELPGAYVKTWLHKNIGQEHYHKMKEKWDKEFRACEHDAYVQRAIAKKREAKKAKEEEAREKELEKRREAHEEQNARLNSGPLWNANPGAASSFVPTGSGGAAGGQPQQQQQQFQYQAPGGGSSSSSAGPPGVAGGASTTSNMLYSNSASNTNVNPFHVGLGPAGTTTAPAHNNATFNRFDTPDFQTQTTPQYANHANHPQHYQQGTNLVVHSAPRAGAINQNENQQYQQYSSTGAPLPYGYNMFPGGSGGPAPHPPPGFMPY